MTGIKPNRRLVEQRMRNRIIEYLEIVCEKHPLFEISEVVDMWEDYIDTPLLRENMPEPVYTPAEQDLLLRVDTAWQQFCAIKPWEINDRSAALMTPEGRKLVDVCCNAADIMMRRGRLSETEEI
jgi:hypothetical protein